MYGWRIGDLGTDGLVMAEFNIDIGKLPEDVREKLAELDLELSEGTYNVISGTVSSCSNVTSTGRVTVHLYDALFACEANQAVKRDWWVSNAGRKRGGEVSEIGKQEGFVKELSGRAGERRFWLGGAGAVALCWNVSIGVGAAAVAARSWTVCKIKVAGFVGKRPAVALSCTLHRAALHIRLDETARLSAIMSLLRTFRRYRCSIESYVSNVSPLSIS
ncbi:hypothetical protein WN48_06193 [Eufriesea mexicana]|uniref:Uncharacterized protein n=1 Tax=Eufriesea mexicana TaxID=516756 RepID=A0A310STT1_9HYME|nr:hypothetical protein WN48_06193 [Eufriesea mexicana]